DLFPTTAPPGRHIHPLHGRFPLFTSDHAATVRAESDQHHAVGGMVFAHEFADVHHAVVCHIGEPGVADVRVVCPDDRLGPRTVMAHEAFQCLGHVPIADVPRLWAALHHRVVVVLRV